MPFRDRLRTHINTKSRPGYPTGFDLAALKQTLKDHIKSIESRLMNCGQDLMEIHERQQGKMKGAKYFLQSVFVNSAKESLLKYYII